MTTDKLSKPHLIPAIRRLAVHVRRLLDDAKYLLKDGRVESALPLAIIADEETSKAGFFLTATIAGSGISGLARLTLLHRAKQDFARAMTLISSVFVPLLWKPLINFKTSPGDKKTRLENLKLTLVETLERPDVREALAFKTPAFLGGRDLQSAKHACLYTDVDQHITDLPS